MKDRFRLKRIVVYSLCILQTDTNLPLSLYSKTMNELSFVKTTKLINPSGIDSLDNFLMLAKQTRVCLFPRCTVSWTEGCVVWMRKEIMDQSFNLRLWGTKALQ